ncbi:MAG: MBOAT family protein [Lachnospiraceae bacterium]|nr:MBOAT family protein [Lachnospiraceae bacterium]
MIVFSNLEFIFRFLPVFLIVYYLTPARYKDAILFLGSIFVYAETDLKAAVLLIAAVVLNFVLGQIVYDDPKKNDAAKRKKAFILILVLDVALLIACKALALFREGFYLPLGISFYLFKMISYQADLYMDRIKKRPSFIRTAAYFTMFPQITQGPIMRYEEGDFDRDRDRRPSLTSFENGLIFFVMGLAFKLLLADRIGVLWNEILKIGYESISTPLAWMGAFAYSFQLYFDFWGYSLMAGGVGMMLGFSFITNFRHPYASGSIAEFYRRWHLTLGNWFRDYVYIPLGGSRKGTIRTILNLLLVWALTGLWHGGTVNFLIWGLALFVLIVLEKFLLGGLFKKVRILGHLYVWLFIPLTWVVFAISDLGELKMYFERLFPFFGEGVALNPGDYLQYAKIYWPYFLAAFCLSAVPEIFIRTVRFRKSLPVLLGLTALFWVCVYFAVTQIGNNFMYFSF